MNTRPADSICGFCQFNSRPTRSGYVPSAFCLLLSAFCLAWLLAGQHAAAEEAAIPPALPFAGAQVPKSALNADEAPRWSAGPAQPTAGAAATATTNTTPSATVSPTTSVPTSAGAKPVESVTIDTAVPASDVGTEAAAQPRPLQSVMKNRPAVVPATLPGATLPSGTLPGATMPGAVVTAPPIATGGALPTGVFVTPQLGLSQAPVSASAPAPTLATGPAPAIASTPGPTAAALTAPAETPIPIQATSPSGVVPARYDEPVQTAPREPFPAQLMPRGAPDARFSGAPNTATVTTPPRAAETTMDPATQAAQQAAARAAADLLAGSLLATGNSGGLSLSDVLTHCAEAERSAAIQAYWRLSRATSNYNWAVDEQKRLDQVVSNHGSVDGPMLSTARAAAAARVTEAELEKIFATAALARAIPALNVSGLTPTDRPLVGPYHTYYNQIFGNRSVGRTWEIDRTLPIRLKAINDRAAAVQSAVSAVHYGEQAHAAGELDLRTVLACHEALHTQRREFLDCALQYNLDIGEYALAAAPVGTPPDKLAGMMIPIKQPERVSAIPGKLATPSSAGTTDDRSARNDGWVSSSLKSLEPEAPDTRTPQNSPRYEEPAAQPRDPFGSSSGDYRYGNGAR